MTGSPWTGTPAGKNNMIKEYEKQAVTARVVPQNSWLNHSLYAYGLVALRL